MSRQALSLSLPVELLTAMERLRGRKPRKTRSRVAAELIRAGLAVQRERELVARDIAAYRDVPESAADRAMVRAALRTLSLDPF